METDKDHIHFLLGNDTTDRVCDIIKKLYIRPHTIYGRNIITFLPNKTGRRKSFGLMAISILILSRLKVEKANQDWDLEHGK